jgi:hypothetical protein
MQNKKDKRTKANGKKLETDAGKTAASGSADAKKGVADTGKKGAQGTTSGKKVEKIKKSSAYAIE